ncbi:response regulator [Sphingomonas sp.]|uniref:response regulator n=1 Tax=Sphingomonas sp. TaxID=28214 RepID=UPI00260013DB|nr:response regulator [Sphingomonas sp.]
MTKLRVLVVDDSLTIRATLEEILQRGDRCRVVGSAATIEEARALILSQDPDVITLDLALPGMDGLSFLDERKAPHLAPSIVISSSTPPGTPASREAMARGAAACFDKGRLVAEGPRLVRELQLAALTHLRQRVAKLERDLKLSGQSC